MEKDWLKTKKMQVFQNDSREQNISSIQKDVWSFLNGLVLHSSFSILGIGCKFFIKKIVKGISI
jgi:hypothetical protein